jgi:hypothetical protein
LETSLQQQVKDPYGQIVSQDGKTSLERWQMLFDCFFSQVFAPPHITTTSVFSGSFETCISQSDPAKAR